MDPFKMEINKNVNYSEDMCQKSLEILRRCAHINIDPDWTEDDIACVAKKIKSAIQ